MSQKIMRQKPTQTSHQFGASGDIQAVGFFLLAEWLVIKTLLEYGFGIESLVSIIVSNAYAKTDSSFLPPSIQAIVAIIFAIFLGIVMLIAAYGAWIAKPARAGALELLKSTSTTSFVLLSGILGVQLVK